MRLRLLIGLSLSIGVGILCLNGRQPSSSQTGWASYYAPSLAGKSTANRELYHPDSLTVAHKSLPFGTRLKVLNLENNRQVIVRVNDRGPFTHQRILDLSQRAFRQLAPLEKGLIKVRITPLP